MSQPLLKDLQELVGANIISAETAGQIEAYYQHKKEPPSNRLTTLLGILGALLVGTGVILVIAHNWDELSKTLQTLIAFLPLALGQALCLFAILKRNDNKGWKESSALFLTLAVASTISMSSQIYQVNGSLNGFLLTWILLSLPLVYIMHASSVSLLLIALATWHACMIGYSGFDIRDDIIIPNLYPAVLLALTPHFMKLFRSPDKGVSFHLHNWFLSVSLCFTLGAYMNKGNNTFEWIFVAYIALFGTYYLAGTSSLLKKERLFANPFIIIGALGIIIIFLCWSFGWLWEDIGDKHRFSNMYSSATAWVLLAACAGLYLLRYRKVNWEEWDIVALSPFIFLAGLLLFRNNANLGMLFFNGWVLALSVHYIRRGAALNHLGILNFGLLIFASLAIMRFFDEEIPFIWRGLIFLAAGAGFFIANSFILRKRKALAKKTGI